MSGKLTVEELELFREFKVAKQQKKIEQQEQEKQRSTSPSSDTEISYTPIVDIDKDLDMVDVIEIIDAPSAKRAKMVVKAMKIKSGPVCGEVAKKVSKINEALGEVENASDYIVTHDRVGKGVRKRYTITKKGFVHLMTEIYTNKKSVDKLSKQFDVGIACIRSFKNKVDNCLINKYLSKIEYFDIFQKQPEL